MNTLYFFIEIIKLFTYVTIVSQKGAKWTKTVEKKIGTYNSGYIF